MCSRAYAPMHPLLVAAVTDYRIVSLFVVSRLWSDIAFSVVVLFDRLCLRAFSFYISRRCSTPTALLLCYSHAGVACIANYGSSLIC